MNVRGDYWSILYFSTSYPSHKFTKSKELNIVSKVFKDKYAAISPNSRFVVQGKFRIDLIGIRINLFPNENGPMQLLGILIHVQEVSNSNLNLGAEYPKAFQVLSLSFNTNAKTTS
jgi:hypothetical protein